MTLHKLTSLGLLLLACAGPLAACSSGSDDPAPGSSAKTSTRVSAEKGGTVADPSGTATLTIPAGALAEDTDITLAVSAATSATIASVYDFGPDGLTFQTPAVLAVKVDATTVGDKEVALAIEQNGKFVPLAGSAYSNGVATAPVEHFSKFSVVFVDGEAVDNACDDAVANFQACGGDIVGTWVADDFCFANVKGILDNCPQQEVSAEIDYVGLEYTFGEDNSFSATAGTENEKLTVVAPLTCFGEASCSSVGSSDPDVACSGEDVCSCTRTRSNPRAAQAGTYSTENGTLTVTTDDEPDQQQYCIQGDKLHVLLANEGAETMLVTFTKK